MAIGVKNRMHLGATTGQFNHVVLTLKEIRLFSVYLCHYQSGNGM